MPQSELPFDASSLAAGPRSVVVLGAGRSGTSMLAGTLAHSGWYVGDRPFPGRDSNPKGFFETPEINGLNEYLLAGAQTAESKLGDGQRWLARVPLGTSFTFPEDLAARVRALGRRRPFAFKDPRLCYTLGAWEPHLGDFARLCIFREPQRTAHSMVKECATAGYLAGVELDYARALEVWNCMYRHLLELHARRGDWLFLHADQLLQPAGLARLESFLGAPVAREFPDAALQRSPSQGELPGATAELYAKLCTLAEYSAPGRSVHSLGAAAPEISVVVCSYNRRETLRECLVSFNAQSAAARMELIVVDDGSADGTAQMLAEFPFDVSHRIVTRKNGGLAEARNSGIAVARGDLLLFVNDDTIAYPDLVERHLACHAAAGPGLHSVLGSFEQPREALANCLMRVLEVTQYVFCYAGMQHGARYGWSRWWTCNVSVPREAVLRAGAFDANFRHYGCEDTDLAIRLERLGGDVIYDSTARAMHRHVLSLADLARRQRTVARAYVRLVKKHPEALGHPDWRWLGGLTASSLERKLVDRLPERGRLEAAAQALSVVDLDHLSGTSTADAAVQSRLLGRLSGLLSNLNAQWWSSGLLEGLREHDLESFAQLLPEPWPLATQAQHRVLAWPRYDSDEDMDRLLGEFGPALAKRQNTCLLLRHDETLDGPVAEAVARLTAAYERNLTPDQVLEVLLLTEDVPANELGRLACAVDAVLELLTPSGDPRTRFLRETGVHSVRAAGELAGCLRSQRGLAAQRAVV